VAGIFSAFASASRWLKPETNASFNIARGSMEPLYGQVAQDAWSGGVPSDLNTGTTHTQTVQADRVDYTWTRDISSVSRDVHGTPSEVYRKVKVTVEHEPSP
jgi:hypothetical protein